MGNAAHGNCSEEVARLFDEGGDGSMKIIFPIARVLLGLLFLVIGFNGFFHFIPAPPPTGVSGQFVGAMYVSHYLAVVWLVQIVGGALLVINRFVPAALNTLGPVLVNTCARNIHSG